MMASTFYRPKRLGLYSSQTIGYASYFLMSYATLAAELARCIRRLLTFCICVSYRITSY